MFPTPASRRWSSRTALIGARRPATASARRLTVNAGASGSPPTLASRYESSSPGSTRSQVPKRRPPSSGSSRARTVSTSGSSGIGQEHFEHDRPVVGRLVGDHVRRTELARNLGGVLLGACVDLGERLSLLNPISALAQAHDADGVVDRVVLGLPSRA